MFGKRLKTLRNTAGFSQKKLASMLDVSQQTVASWEVNRSSPSPEMLSKIAQALEIDVNMLLDHRSPSSTAVRIPVLGRVQAGIPLDAIEEILDWEEIPDELAKQGEFFALKVRGDSMEPRICDGDVVIVRQRMADGTIQTKKVMR